MSALGFGLGLGVGRAGTRVLLPPMFDFTGGGLPYGATLERSTPATHWNATGVLATVGAQVARFDHDPASGAARGLLIEPAATNLLARSATFEQAPWNATFVTVAADQAAAPDGSVAADRLTATGSSSFIYQVVGLTAGADYCLSGYIRDAGAATSLITAIFAGGGAAYGIGPATLTPAAEWRRFVLAGNIGSHNAPFWAALGGASSFSTGETLFAWGMQLEAGATASSLIPTGEGAGTRAADTLTLAWNTRGVADGAVTVRYTFDDGSTQDVATTISRGNAVVPTGLARRWLVRAAML